MKILKSTISIFLVLMLLLVSVVPVAFAVDSSNINTSEINTSEINTWSNDYFESIFNLDRNKFKDFESLVNERLQDRKVNNSLMYFESKLDSRFFILLTDGSISVEHIGVSLFSDVVSDCTYVLYLQVNYSNDRNCYFSQSDLIETTSYSLNKMSFSDKISNCYTSEDIEFANNSSLTFYYSKNIYKEFLNFIAGGQQFCDVTKTSGKNFIFYYDWIDSYKGKYNYDMFTDILNTSDDMMLNYLNSSVSFKDNLYYTSNMNSNYNDDATQHSETLTFYLEFNDEMQDELYSYYCVNHQKLNYDFYEDIIEEYLLKNTVCKHYKDNEVTFFNWYKNYIAKRMSNVSNYFSLHTISSTKYAKNIHFYLKFDMPNNYSYISNTKEDASIFSGYRTASSAKIFNFLTGSTVNTGFGSNIDNSDLGTLKDKFDLLDNGWKNGYPNQSGDYPYRLDMYKNNKIFLQVYFKSKPGVHAYGYTDTQIKYSVDVSNVVGYAYIKDYNISYSFDVKSLLNDLKKSNSSLDTVFSALETGLDVTSLVSSSLSLSVISIAVDLFEFLTTINNDTQEFQRNFDFVFWTNFVGSETDFRGYKTVFNWDVGVDGAFVRDNSDDTHDYSKDYVKDVPVAEVSTEISTDSSGNTIYTYNTWNYYQYDNNGNVHGGGDDTYIATELSTTSISYDYNNYDYASSLTSNANSFFDFIARAMSFMPSWVYLSIAASLAVLVVLRILSR